MSRVQAGVNAPREEFEGVFSPEARARIAELVDVDFTRVPADLTPESVADSVRGARVILSTWGALPYSREILAACPDLELILYAAGTFKKYVTPELREAAPTVCTAAHLNAIPTAEYSLMLILAALKDFMPHHLQLRESGPAGWRKEKYAFDGGYYRSVVALLGLGAVSRHLITLLHALDVTILVADDYLTAETADQLGVTAVDLDEAMRRADVVSIHHADVERNWNLVNRRTLALLKDGARLINTSRGRMIDEDALVEVLETGRITAYLDVTEPEPPREGHRFYTLPNCILTPHIAGSFGREVHRMGDYCVRELEHRLAGEPFEHTIDIHDLDSRA